MEQPQILVLFLFESLLATYPDLIVEQGHQGPQRPEVEREHHWEPLELAELLELAGLLVPGAQQGQQELWELVGH